MLKCIIARLVYIVFDCAPVGAPIRFNYWMLIKPYCWINLAYEWVYVILCAICTVILIYHAAFTMGDQASGPSSLRHARRLLYQIVDLVCNDEGAGPSDSAGSSPVRPLHAGTSSRFPPLFPNRSQDRTASSSSISEQSRLFGFNSKAGKRGKQQSVKNSVVTNSSSKKIMWSRECLCLASSLHDSTPTSREKMLLASNGLGIKRLDFCRDAKSEEIDAVVLAAFPKLIGLGYEFLITDRKSSRLVVIATPAEGMTITYLKDIVLQSKLYIRPINGDVEVTVLNLHNIISECTYSS